MSQSKNKRIVILGLPRTGTCALRHSLEATGLNICPGEPYFQTDHAPKVSATWRHDHIRYSNKIFEIYDGFKIIVGHSEQVLDICANNNAKLILTRRRDFLSFMASYYILINGAHTGRRDPREYSTWTSTGHKVEYKPMPFTSHHIDKFLYYNHLIDNVYNKNQSYLTTVNFEDVSAGVSDLENYLDSPIDLNITANTSISKYFTNPEEFKEDIENRVRKILGHKRFTRRAEIILGY